jgi:hypothetical protein
MSSSYVKNNKLVELTFEFDQAPCTCFITGSLNRTSLSRVSGVTCLSFSYCFSHYFVSAFFFNTCCATGSWGVLRWDLRSRGAGRQKRGKILHSSHCAVGRQCCCPVAVRIPRLVSHPHCRLYLSRTCARLLIDTTRKPTDAVISYLFELAAAAMSHVHTHPITTLCAMSREQSSLPPNTKPTTHLPCTSIIISLPSHRHPPHTQHTLYGFRYEEWRTELTTTHHTSATTTIIISLSCTTHHLPTHTHPPSPTT